MSGGHFQYDQYVIQRLADAIEELIESNDDKSLNEYGQQRGREYPPEVVEEFRVAVDILRVAFAYVHRIDWLVSGDDSEEYFLSRLDADVKEIKR